MLLPTAIMYGFVWPISRLEQEMEGQHLVCCVVYELAAKRDATRCHAM